MPSPAQKVFPSKTPTIILDMHAVLDLMLKIIRIGADDSDSDDVRLRKSLLVVCSLVILLCGLLWGAIYLAFDEPLAAAVPWTYSILSLLSTLNFARGRNFRFYLFAQLLLILLLPFLLQMVLGGFLNSSAVVLWSLISPIGALIFAGRRRAGRWFAAFLALVIVCAVAQPLLRMANNLPPPMIIAFFVLNISAISAIVFTLLMLFIRQRDTAYGLLQVEQDKSESLLLNILPKEIAEILKNRGNSREGNSVIANYYADVSVLFADVVNFTPLSAELPPQVMVGILDEIFTCFDELVDKHGVEKIETIGDEYMAACGVPRICPGHAKAVARLALDMRDYLHHRKMRNDRIGERRLDIRIGIHSGPVVGGVIGRRKFAFELFGDTVNTAHRMQSHGVPGNIQITQRTYELIKDDFICEPRGALPIKGKGEMETWFVMAAKSDIEELPASSLTDWN